jgi:SAM-dependent methyltransferase
MASMDHALVRRLDGRMRSSGQLALLPVPSIAALYVERLSALFAGIGCPLDAADREVLAPSLGRALEEAWASGAHARVEVRWRASGGALKYRLQVVQRTAAEAYEEWAVGRASPMFGAHPDAAVTAAAAEFSGGRVLDLGAGSGRNAIPLAAAGHRVLAVELAPSLVQKLREAGIPVIQGDVLDPALPVAPGAHDLVVASELATNLRDAEALRRLLATSADWLVPGGVLVLNAFVCDDGFEPSEAVRQASAAMWCTAFTRADVAAATEELPLSLIGDVPALALERAEQPSWPPTGWFEGWASGRDLFALDGDASPPVALRWLTWRRR